MYYSRGEFMQVLLWDSFALKKSSIVINPFSCPPIMLQASEIYLYSSERNPDSVFYIYAK